MIPVHPHIDRSPDRALHRCHTYPHKSHHPPIDATPGRASDCPEIHPRKTYIDRWYKGRQVDIREGV